MDPLALERLVREFADAAIRSDEAIVSGPGEAARKYSKKKVALHRRIWEFGDEGKEALLTLLDHPDPSARVAAAAYLLKFRTERALAVLREAAGHEGLVAFGAQECLKRWDEGTWNLD